MIMRETMTDLKFVKVYFKMNITILNFCCIIVVFTTENKGEYFILHINNK